MYKEIISQKQAIVLMITFIIGSNTILVMGGKSKQDIWIAVIFAIAAACVLVAVYARIAKLFPEKHLFEILDILFGKVFGRIIVLFFAWYLFHIGAAIVKNISEFIRIISLDSTPVCIISLMTGIVIAYAVRSGLEVMGRLISIIFPIWITGTLVLAILSIGQYDINRLKPVLYEGLEPVISDAFRLFALPFAETVVFLCFAGSFQRKSSPYKIYYYSLLVGGFYLATVVARTVMMIGADNLSMFMYPLYVTARLIRVGNFLEKIELISAVLIISCTFTKATVYLFSFTKGVAYLFNIRDYHRIAAPSVFLASIYSMPLYESAIEMIKWAQDIFPYYSIPFQIILPVAVWITAEIKLRKNKNTTAENPQNQAM